MLSPKFIFIDDLNSSINVIFSFVYLSFKTQNKLNLNFFGIYDE
ncbi:hypothetical protein AOLE_10345 [Acinetobacter oleivorans DR1]|uniref:Uncharacterized protein n=1 Tax=Acinetobacter oleivorans (strain JCM 16667 / KCTC 23045 / DR1) TaxID=436717 RepID=A0AAN0UDB6_ACISD|nr:hypothetical protein AOLE_10345 [Acinetobacter oleivorans DR1]